MQLPQKQIFVLGDYDLTKEFKLKNRQEGSTGP